MLAPQNDCCPICGKKRSEPGRLSPLEKKLIAALIGFGLVGTAQWFLFVLPELIRILERHFG